MDSGGKADVASRHDAETDWIEATEALLASRPARAADHARENAALLSLADEMSERPGNGLERLCELVLELCGAESAGISLIRGDGAAAEFHWPAICGL